MAAGEKAKSKDKKAVAWKVPPVLRHWLNSHAEYLSAIGEEISTDELVAEWLSEKLKAEEQKRSQAALEQALNAVLESKNANPQRSVRRSSSSRPAR